MSKIMKNLLAILLFAITPFITFSQQTIIKTYPVKQGQQINLSFDYPKLIKISSWDKNEVSIVATVTIDNEEKVNAFTLTDSLNDNTLSIRNKIDWDKVPTMYYLSDKGVKTNFKTKQGFDNYKKENDGNLPNASFYQQRNIDVQMEIKIPVGVYANIKSVYGMIELANFNSPAMIEAKYGGIDASMNEGQIGKIKLTNRYGAIYTNLNLIATEKKDANFFTSITAEPGKGPAYDLSSSYGNIYLRKSSREK
jgi:hypothetical protein